ncbi:MAG: dienelactone hydrolase family protein [Microcystaceae cyanobacterium]
MKRYFFPLTVLGFLCALLWTGIANATHPNLSYPQQMWQLHQSDRPIPSPLVSQAPRQAVTGRKVTYGNIADQPLMGYLSHPSGAEDNLPAVIVIHEWWGLNENITKMTDKLAGEGYTALAVDLYGGKIADNPKQARALVTEALKNPRLLQENLKQAYLYLEKGEKAPKIGTIGWCFGGTWSLNTALLLPQQIDATVIYYGGGITTDAEKLKTLEMPILGIFGELDQNPPPETVKQFETTLNDLGKSADIHIYPDADHAFANPSGNRYNQAAAKDAWQKTTAFLAKYLK